MSRIELDDLIDGVQRAATAIEHCSRFCEQAQNMFKNEAAAVLGCKHSLERFRSS